MNTLMSTTKWSSHHNSRKMSLPTSDRCAVIEVLRELVEKGAEEARPPAAEQVVGEFRKTRHPRNVELNKVLKACF
jgi:hypothetical protein